MLSKKGLIILTIIYFLIILLVNTEYNKFKRIGNNSIVTLATVYYKRIPNRPSLSTRFSPKHEVYYEFSPFHEISPHYKFPPFNELSIKGKCTVHKEAFDNYNIGDKVEITYNKLNFKESYCGNLTNIKFGRITATNPSTYLLLPIIFVYIILNALYLLFSKKIRQILFSKY